MATSALGNASRSIRKLMARGETGVWAVEGLPLKIEYANSVLEEIRAAAVAGFYRFPRGGLEVGGLLFGLPESDTVHVLAARPVACEYLYGPSYTLSEKDEVLFRRMLHAPGVDPALRGLQPVGWYHSHTRSGIFLSEQALGIHNRYFPRYWQAALVVRPQPYGATRAGFFVREADGTLRSESSHLEFDVTEAAPGAHAAALAAVEQPEPAPPPAPPLEQEPPPQRRRSLLKWALAPLAIALLAAAAMLAPHDKWLARTPPRLSLRVLELDGMLDIAWDPAAGPIRAARAASLEIQDGDDRAELPLDPNTLLQGRFSYFRHSASVEVRLRVYPREGNLAEESVHVVGKPVPPPPSPTASVSAEATPPPEPALPAARRPEPRTDNEALKPPPAPRPVARRTFSFPRSVERAAGRAPVSPLLEPPLSSAPAAVAQAAPRVLERAGSALPPPPRPAQPPAAKPGYSGPPSGRLIWTGRLPRGATLAIDGPNASSGSLNGHLPGVPVHLTAHPARLLARGLVVYIYNPASARREAAGPQNGWNDTSFEWDPQQAIALNVVEAPRPDNNWKRLVMRAGRAPISVIVIEWQVLN